jgi:hypothetical protein
MAEVVGFLAPWFKAQGFQKQRHTFNRAAGNGATQVVSFQMGRHQPPGTQEIPLRPHLHGAFTANLGVHFAEVARLLEAGGIWVPRDSGLVRESSCQIRKRLGFLTPDRRDVWWNLDAPANELAASLQQLLEAYALPYLDRVSDPEAVLDAWVAREDSVRHALVGRDAAVLAAIAGRSELAGRIFRDCGLRPDHESHATMARLAASVGLDVT